MDSKLRKLLAEAIEQIESGADVESVLARFPEQADALLPHLSVWTSLGTVPAAAAADAGAMARGRREMLTMLTRETERSGLMPGFLSTAGAKFAAIALAVLLLAGGTAGASAAFGGGGGPTAVLDFVGFTESDAGPDENASQRCENSDDGRNNASASSGNGAAHANPRAFEGGNGDPNCDKDEEEAATEGAGECAVDDADEADDADDTDDADDDADEDDCDDTDDDDCIDGSPEASPEATEDADDDADEVDDVDDGECDNEDDDGVDDDDASGPSENSGEGSENSDDGIDNADDDSETGADCADENAFDGSDNSDDGADNGDGASDSGEEQCADDSSGPGS